MKDIRSCLEVPVHGSRKFRPDKSSIREKMMILCWLDAAFQGQVLTRKASCEEQTWRGILTLDLMYVLPLPGYTASLIEVPIVCFVTRISSLYQSVWERRAHYLDKETVTRHLYLGPSRPSDSAASRKTWERRKGGENLEENESNVTKSHLPFWSN